MIICYYISVFVLKGKGAVVAVSNGIGPLIGAALASASDNGWYVKAVNSQSLAIICFYYLMVC